MANTPRTIALAAVAALTPAIVLAACGSDETQSNTTTNPSTSSSSSSSAGGSTSSSSSAASGGQGGTGVGGVGGAGGAGGGGASAGGGGQGGSAMAGINCDPPMGNAGNITLTPFITSGLTNPLQLTAPKGDGTRMFIIEQAGTIRLYKNNTLSTFLDITSVVNAGGERGLLGLAFHPNYNSNGRFFVHYSDSSGNTRIAEYQRDSNNPDIANPTPVNSQVLSVTQPFSNHNGGSIEFSPVDGFLYIGLGDGGSGGDPMGNGQNTNSLLGALLRIDVSNPNQYVIPAGNISATSEIYDYGLRNPYRWTFDACNGTRYIGDVGQNAYEEVDVALANDGNKNWGWNVMEGLHCYSPMSGCNMSGKDMPAIEYPHSLGCSITGGYVYRGSAISWLRGAYLYGDYCSGRLWTFRWNNGVVTDASLLLDTPYQITGFGQDDDGEVYVMDYQGDDIYRIDAN